MFIVVMFDLKYFTDGYVGVNYIVIDSLTSLFKRFETDLSAGNNAFGADTGFTSSTHVYTWLLARFSAFSLSGAIVNF